MCLISCNLYAQYKNDNLYGSWVKVKVTSANGVGLSDENILKYNYLKYTFSYSNEFSASTAYYERGTTIQFDLKQNVLTILTPEGGMVNSFQIESISDTLVITQKGRQDFNDPSALKYYFVPEYKYQNAIPLQPAHIYSIKGNDTLYKASPKNYANYKGPSFQSFIYKGIAESIDMHNREGHFVATFIVSKAGIADSVKVIDGIDEKFTKRFLKVFERAKKDWRPATLNGKYVPVVMLVDLRYLTFGAAESFFLSTKGNKAYNEQDYEKALYYFDQALIANSSDKDNLLKRGVCRMMLGNSKGACEDWNTIITLGGSSSAETMLEKYCR
jgi:tetratricopeptide (TPR) repeat protein